MDRGTAELQRTTVSAEEQETLAYSALTRIIAESFHTLDDRPFPTVVLPEALALRIYDDSRKRLGVPEIACALARCGNRGEVVQVRGRLDRTRVGWTTPVEVRRARASLAQIKRNLSTTRE